MGVPAGGGMEPTEEGDLRLLEPGVSGERLLADVGLLDPAEPKLWYVFSLRSEDVTGTVTGIA